MELRALSQEDCEKVRKWRNQDLSALRTPFLLTKEMQADFYRERVSNRNSTDRFWGIWEPGPKPVSLHVVSGDAFLGMGGITGIQWENSIGEISLMLDPEYLGKGHGKIVVELLLHEAFRHLNLKTVFGECYACNPAFGFWKKLANKQKNVCWVILPNRKYRNGQYLDAAYFSFDRDNYAK